MIPLKILTLSLVWSMKESGREMETNSKESNSFVWIMDSLKEMEIKKRKSIPSKECARYKVHESLNCKISCATHFLGLENVVD